MAAATTDDDCIDLPPGFRFHPTDEEIITHYLTPKILNRGFGARAIGEVDLNKCEPWDLPSKAKMGEKELYFFCQRDRKYPTGMRTNRATQAGYWKATGKDKEIFKVKGVLVGMKKTLVFYRGRAPRGEKTNWVMHEFRLHGNSFLPNLSKSAKDEWVVCRVIHKNMGGLKKTPSPGFGAANLFDSEALPPLTDDHPLPSYTDSPAMIPGSSFINGTGDHLLFDFKSFPSMLNMAEVDQQQQAMIMRNHHQPSQFIIPNPAAQEDPALLSHQLVVPNPQIPHYLHHQANYMDHHESAIRNKHCKVEQCSNQSMGCPSQETGLSTDGHTTAEISSGISTHFDDFDDWPSYGF